MMPKKQDIATLFGRRLRSLRLAKEITQAELAETSELSVNFVSLVERGLKSPTLATIERLARSLQVPVIDLFRFDDEGE